ncbi:unnamed protein product, partial [Rotaria sp. Silwood1]
ARDGTQTRSIHGVTDLDNKTPVESIAIGCYEKPTIDSEKQENDDDKSPSMKNTESKTNTTIPYELQRRNQPSITGYILLVWITTLLYQAMRHLFSLEAQTTCNAIVQYFEVFWNKLDVLAIILFCVSFILRCIPLTECFYAACIVWPIDIIIWFIRSLDIFVAIKRLGPKLVMIGEMIDGIYVISNYSFSSNIFDRLQNDTDRIWKFQRYSLICEYLSRPSIPPPFIIVAHHWRLILTTLSLEEKFASNIETIEDAFGDEVYYNCMKSAGKFTEEHDRDDE